MGSSGRAAIVGLHSADDAPHLRVQGFLGTSTKAPEGAPLHFINGPACSDRGLVRRVVSWTNSDGTLDPFPLCKEAFILVFSGGLCPHAELIPSPRAL